MTSVLNEDLFYEIFAACSVSTLVNISLVSTRFYMAAMPYLLRDATFDRSPELLSRFLHFIIDNSAATSLRTDRHPVQPHIAARRLRIADPGKYVSTFELYERGCRTTKEGPNARSGLIHVRPEPYPCKLWAPLLTQAISLMPNLRSVAIHSRFDKICRCSPQFLEVLLTRPRLTSFTVPDFDCASSRAVGEVVRERKADMAKLRKIAFDDADAGEFCHVGAVKSEWGLTAGFTESSASASEY
ncbi:hypothetical protein CVT26_001043 [Gymnopilus dilepis]|uniref:F-box domain-containing protein n=1 Tax=Gymnopilus dilepis TaxID=231916 RepID=A0A409WLK8_9AGAR|nr:hypothetical protein CVT26_001043 [Gymnopilus dilepis]